MCDCVSLFSPLPRTPVQTADDADDAAGHRSLVPATMQTGFCDWSARYFAQPVMKVACVAAHTPPPGAQRARRPPLVQTRVGQSLALGSCLASFLRAEPRPLASAVGAFCSRPMADPAGPAHCPSWPPAWLPLASR